MLEEHPITYDLNSLPRELTRHYISATDEDIKEMLEAVGAESLEDLFSHIPEECRFAEAPDLPDELEYDKLLMRMAELSANNNEAISFIGDGLQPYRVHEIVPFVSSIRTLTTAYTPYQPERSQGTLLTHWIYQCLLSQLTGFEAINASLYDRATALYEACCCAVRIKKKTDTVLVCESIYPGDIEVLKTQCADNAMNIEFIPVDSQTGMMSIDTVRAKIEELGGRVAAIAFPQENHLGLLEDVNALTNLAAFEEILSIAIVDPMQIGTGALKAPADFGHNGCDIVVGEAQHLAIGANFGGPGLGMFGIRHNDEVKTHLRSTPGRFVGQACDLKDRDCLVQVLSTREQHIRKEKATSNICSNQAFLATLAGASILARGERGMQQTFNAGHDMALTVATEILTKTQLQLAFPSAAFANEVTFVIPEPAADAIKKGVAEGIHIGVDVSDRIEGNECRLLKVSCTDYQSDNDAKVLIDFFLRHYPADEHDASITFENIPTALRRVDALGLPQLSLDEVKEFYTKCGELNISPDDTCYPLGSCTMKYNPYVNDWAATLPGFVNAHPQSPLEDVQGCLEVLHEIQEWFKKITGLAAITTQPVAGAQGELVGLKLFQAYHRANHKEGDAPRDVILIPRSAHGTNFATATMAGFETKKVDGLQVGIVYLDADETGCIDPADLDAKIETYGPRISGVMITNPNTGGVFETDFKSIADKIHNVGGLVYMDGANMNAICGWVDLGAMGVDAVHNNLHKTWSIPHGGGGPGDAIVGVSDKLVDFLPGYQIEKDGDQFVPVKPAKSIGSFHRHWGNFAHKVRALTYIYRLGREGVRRISAMSVLSSRYVLSRLKDSYPQLPKGADAIPRMHEFILTLSEEDFAKLESVGIQRAQAIPRIGKVFLDFGFHSPTVAFPEVFGLMIEPTETYSKAELDRFSDAVLAIKKLIQENPEAIANAPYFTPVDRVDEVTANRNVALSAKIESLPELHTNRFAPSELNKLSIDEIYDKICGVAAV